MYTNLLLFFPDSFSYQTPRIPASRSAQSNLTIFTQIPLPDTDKSARSTEMVTHAEIHRDDVRDSPSRSPPVQPRSQTGFANPLFHPTRNNHHDNHEVSSKNGPRSTADSHGAMGFPSAVGAGASPKIPSAPMEENGPDRDPGGRNDAAKPCELSFSMNLRTSS